MSTEIDQCKSVGIRYDSRIPFGQSLMGIQGRPLLCQCLFALA
ncbi:hypothetical protein QQY66_48035 [Streptomyces sp. DG2A-72]|nr:hypothetical protein [Streptomyces sp. DG2A-72]MDO0939085.1 hypothetical protein [Streptomyces sp. DG2A-72]